MKGQNIIKAANGATFASEWYARTKGLNTTPGGLFDDNIMAHYKNKYNMPGAYRMQDIDIWLDLTSTDTIVADDVNGPLTIKYIIASVDGVDNNNSDERSLSITKTIGGFKTINQQEVKNLFALQKKPGANESRWKGKRFNWFLFKQGSNPLTIDDVVVNSFNADKDYHLLCNGDGIENENRFLLKGNNNCSKLNESDIWIENIVFSKSSSENNLTITVRFCGGDVTWTVSP